MSNRKRLNGKEPLLNGSGRVRLPAQTLDFKIDFLPGNKRSRAWLEVQTSRVSTRSALDASRVSFFLGT